MSLNSVLRRDGSVIPFNLDRIIRAVSRAGLSTNDATILADCVESISYAKHGATVTVEQIQDVVESSLMSLRHFDAAKAYVLRRDEKARLRRRAPISQATKQAFADSAAYFPTPLQQFQFFDKYSRFDYTTGRRETWIETVNRATSFLRELVALHAPHCNPDAILGPEIDSAILGMGCMPSMRLLATAGVAARRQNISVYNCSYLCVSSLHAFVEALLISMSGCGVGFSVEAEHVYKLPHVRRQRKVAPLAHTVDDSTEGWCEALLLGLQVWFDGCDITFDYSQLRPAGTVLKTKGGRASGPEPLRRLLDYARTKILSRQGASLSPLDAHDLMCAVGDAAVCGGHRRTAMISLYDRGDIAMRECKNGASFPQIRWNANNSEVWPEGGVSDMDILQQMTAMFQGERGEPGIFSRDAAMRTMPERRCRVEAMGVNPCSPGFATVLTPEGIRTFDDIDVGSIIWSGMQWTKVVRKLSTGVKPVYEYRTHVGIFVGTENHQVISRGSRVEVKDAKQIDVALPPHEHNQEVDMWLRDNVSNSAGIFKAALLKSLEGANLIKERNYLGEFPVYDITVDAPEHTYWTGGLHVSNCGEIVLRDKGLCNLSIVVARPNDTVESLRRKVEIATTIGTVQSLATHFPGLRDEWKRNCIEERLLGVDITGQADCAVLRSDDVLRHLRDVAVERNRLLAQKLHINQSAAVTCVKPSGNSSQLLGCSSGLHNRHAAYYVRNVRVSSHSPVYKVLRDAGVPLSPENGQREVDATTWVASFPIKSPDGAVLRSDAKALDQLETWKRSKLNWTEHNPSVTITYRPDEMVGIVAWLAANRDIVGGLSFLPYSDAKYEQMPYIEITEEEYARRLAQFPEIDWSKLMYYEESDLTTAAQELACSAGKCEL